MNQVDRGAVFNLRPYFPNGGRFTSGEIRDLIAEKEEVDPNELNMTDVFSAIAALHQQQGEVRIDGRKYVFSPLPPTPVTMAGFDW